MLTQQLPRELRDMGAWLAEHDGNVAPTYALSGASVLFGVSAFIKVSVLNERGRPRVGARVVRLFPDGNGEVIAADESGVVSFQSSAKSAFTTPGSGPFTIFVTDDDTYKDFRDDGTKRIVGKDGAPAVRLSQTIHSLGDFRGAHTEIYLQFTDERADVPPPTSGGASADLSALYDAAQEFGASLAETSARFDVVLGELRALRDALKPPLT